MISMRMLTIRCLVTVLLGIAVVDTASATPSTRHIGECISGNCDNGYGTAFDLAVGGNMTGPWRNSDWVPGATYQIEHPKLTNMRFTLSIGSDGYPESGTTFRAAMNKPGIFTGTYRKIKNVFQKDVLTFVPDKGEFLHPGGMKYSGGFEYIPVRKTFDGNGYFAGGIWVFAGDSVDTLADQDDEEDRVKPYTGLFVSDVTPPGTVMRFSKATPDHLQVIIDDYQKSFRAEAADRERSQRNRALIGQVLDIFSTAMSLVGGDVKSIASLGGLTNAKSMLSGMALDTVRGAITGESDVATVMSGDVGEKLKKLANSTEGAKSANLLSGVESVSKKSGGK